MTPSSSSKRNERARALRVCALALWTSLWLAGCLDYNPFAREDDKPQPGRNDSTGTDSAPWPELTEICDGLDNDGDGAADEDFEDLDANGVKDCLECDALARAEQAIAVRSDCGPPVAVDDPWNVVIELEVPGLGSLWSPPLVGDLDADGTTELLVIKNAPDGELYSIDGQTGEIEWRRPWESSKHTASTIANVRGDAKLEIISHMGNFDAYPMLMAHDGSMLWLADLAVGTWRFCIPIVADLEGDGSLELVSSDAIFDLQTGIALGTLPWDDDQLPFMAVGDIDLDGTQEIARQGCVFGHDFVERWCAEDWHPTYYSTAALLQFDDDPEAEVMFLTDEMTIHDTDGSVLVQTSIAPDLDSSVSPPTIADFDGDGAVEVAFSTRNHLQLRELDGSLAWRRTLVDISNGNLGIVSFDFDANGANELVVTDEDYLYILDGSDGTTLWEDDRHASQTVLDHPIVVDIDSDGSAEIVEISMTPDEDNVSLRVFGHADNAWPSTGTHWPSYDFQVTNIREDGSLCTEEPYPWQEWNMVRARPAGEGPRPNHTLVLNETCGGTCMEAGFIEVSVQVGNDGIRAALAGASLSLYRLDGQQRVLLDQTATQAELAPGTLGASQILRAPVHEVRGATLQLELVGDPTRPECDTIDDILTFDSPC